MLTDTFESIALVIRYFPAEKRLSGLTSFGRELAIELGNRCKLTVFSGDKDELNWFENRSIKHHYVQSPFWARVWPELRRVSPSHIIVLSGIHSPRWSIPQALCLASTPVHIENRLFVQAVGLDSPWSQFESRALGRVARVAALNPKDARALKTFVPNALELTPGVSNVNIQNLHTSIKNRPLRVGFLGHLNEIKGADQLPYIFDAVPSGSVQFIIAGVGHLAPQLEKWAETSPHQVEMHGFLENPMELLASLDILIAPFRQSATVLGLSQVVLEAIARGIPVVGTPVDAIQGAVRNGVEGLIVKSNEELASAIMSLLKDSDQRTAMSIAARERSQMYTIRYVADSMLSEIGLGMPPINRGETQ